MVKMLNRISPIVKNRILEVKDQKELAGVFERLTSLDFHSHSQKAARDWVQSNLGSAEKIYELTHDIFLNNSLSEITTYTNWKALKTF